MEAAGGDGSSPVLARNVEAAAVAVLFCVVAGTWVRVGAEVLRRAGVCAVLRRYELSSEVRRYLAVLDSGEFATMLGGFVDVLEDSEGREGVQPHRWPYGRPSTRCSALRPATLSRVVFLARKP